MDNSPSKKQDELLAELLPFFKALADPNRLRIAGLLANQELSVEQLAELLGLRPSTVSHHLSYLSHIGLVSARAKSYYNLYRLENSALDRLAQRLLQRETLQFVTVQESQDSYDRKIIANFTDADGRIKTLPAQRKKLEVILRYVLRAFEPGVRYSEKRVNEILSQYNKDTATLRRELVDYHLLMREGGGGEYWLPESEL
jgi:predicted transcriptional regulator